MWIDTHCHLNLPEFATDNDAVRLRAREAGVDAAVLVGIDIDTSRRALEMAASESWFAPAVGIHPHDAISVNEDAVEMLAGMAGSAAAIGETGLDYYRMHSPQEPQREAFRMQIDLAIEKGKPLVIHCRDAHDDILSILKGFGRPLRGVMHCFSGEIDFARECIDLGFYISFAGPVTYPKSDALREVAASVPEDRILIETDCPFLAPQPVRGKRNEPAYIRFTGEMVAHVRGIETKRLAEITSRNARALFGLPESAEAP